MIASLCCRAPWVRIILDGKNKCAPLSYLSVIYKTNYDQVPSNETKGLSLNISL